MNLEQSRETILEKLHNLQLQLTILEAIINNAISINEQREENARVLG